MKLVYSTFNPFVIIVHPIESVFIGRGFEKKRTRLKVKRINYQYELTCYTPFTIVRNLFQPFNNEGSYTQALLGCLLSIVSIVWELWLNSFHCYYYSLFSLRSSLFFLLWYFKSNMTEVFMMSVNRCSLFKTHGWVILINRHYNSPNNRLLRKWL